ncbi:hypothetical protein D3C78_1358410 [compost metagenome]
MKRGLQMSFIVDHLQYLVLGRACVKIGGIQDITINSRLAVPNAVQLGRLAGLQRSLERFSSILGEFMRIRGIA